MLAICESFVLSQQHFRGALKLWTDEYYQRATFPFSPMESGASSEEHNLYALHFHHFIPLVI